MAIRGQGQALAVGLLVLVGGAACGSAGQPRPVVPHVTGVDYSTDEAANYQAAQLAMRLERVLPPFPGYAGMQIVAYGIEIDVVGEPPAAVRAAIARYGMKYQGREIPVRFRAVRNSQAQLQAVTRRIGSDRDGWVSQGIEPTTWGIDLDTNTVEIRLAHYQAAYAAALIGRYGDRFVSVYPHDYVVTTGG
ncbi:MAG: hypothetical protein QOE23_1010 [Pseudonocardiales bacterium]|jgi:hypothetical protein|nr:hypothetical protein [Pseudonocardiales bacterium]